jgi:tripartite-type tricarboxylate transporter receptor subunit TctC
MRSDDAYHPGSGSSSPLMISTPTVSPRTICLWRVAVAIVLVLLPLQLPVQAQNYPTRPIRLISPFPAGGANDVLASVLAGKLAERLGGAVVVENRPGAGAVIGLMVLARSAPDGYTLALSGGTLAVAGTLYKQPPFDAMKDFAPVALVTHYPFVLVVNPSLPAHSVPELIRLAKEQPGKLLYASPGAASSQHLYTELFKGMAGIELGHIPYSGTAPAVVDILAGRVALMFAAAAPTLPLIREGKLRALGVTSIERLEEAPEIPPIADTIPGFNALNWTIVLAPAETPKEIVLTLHGELKAIMAMRDVQAQIGRIGMFPVDSPEPGALASVISAEVTRWGRIVQQAGIAGTQ